MVVVAFVFVFVLEKVMMKKSETVQYLSCCFTVDNDQWSLSPTASHVTHIHSVCLCVR